MNASTEMEINGKNIISANFCGSLGCSVIENVLKSCANKLA
jgi:hypothetical protein